MIDTEAGKTNKGMEARPEGMAGTSTAWHALLSEVCSDNGDGSERRTRKDIDYRRRLDSMVRTELSRLQTVSAGES